MGQATDPKFLAQLADEHEDAAVHIAADATHVISVNPMTKSKHAQAAAHFVIAEGLKARVAKLERRNDQT